MNREQQYFLVVEDDVDGQEVVSRILKYHHIPFACAGNGEDAYTLMMQYPFTALIIDLQLPGIDGWTLLQAIREQEAWTQLPCFAVTAYHSTDVAVKAIEAGFTAYFPKPLDATSFVRQIEAYLN